MRLDGKVAVVTGGASGIGAGIVRRFHAEGASVVVADVRDAAGKELAGELGERAAYVHTDVAREEDVAALVDSAVERFGGLDVMVNNAGILGATGPIDATSLAEADTTIAIHLRGVLCGMKHAARVMKPRRSGVILSMSSPAALLGGVGAHVYSAVKAGVIGLSNSVAAELRRYGVRVNVLVPGGTVTSMTAAIVVGDPNDLAGAEAALTPTAYMHRPLRPDDIAAAAVYLASDDAELVTGVVLPVDAGMTGAGGPSPYATGKYGGTDD